MLKYIKCTCCRQDAIEVSTGKGQVECNREAGRDLFSRIASWWNVSCTKREQFIYCWRTIYLIIVPKS